MYNANGQTYSLTTVQLQGQLAYAKGYDRSVTFDEDVALLLPFIEEADRTAITAAWEKGWDEAHQISRELRHERKRTHPRRNQELNRSKQDKSDEI